MAQGQLERDTMQRLHKMSAPQWLAKHHLLSARLYAPHATHASQHDLKLYAEHGVSIAHSPLVSARMGSILHSFAACRARGINIGMATDTAPPDMLMNLLVGLIDPMSNGLHASREPDFLPALWHGNRGAPCRRQYRASGR